MSHPRSTAHFAVSLMIAACAWTAHAEPARITVNPYTDVDWTQNERHHGNFHTHTTESDGSQDPAAVIDEYHQIGHDVLALTDHNNATWPWTDFGRDPDALEMIPVPGNELSRHHHTLSLFSELETDASDHETAIRQVHEIGGVSILAHPGRYWDLDDGQVPEDVRDRYTRLFTSYDSLLGMEVVNQGDRYPHDRALWDALLTELMPERPVWGMANDDSHGVSQIGLNTTVLLLSEFSDEEVPAALEDGRYYFTTVTSHPQDERDPEKTPVIQRIEHDQQANTLTIEAVTEGEPLPADAYTWISSGGQVVHEGPTLDLAATDGLAGYVRAEIRGPGGMAYTQPFGLEYRETDE